MDAKKIQKVINIIKKGEKYFKVSSTEPKEIIIRIKKKHIKVILIKKELKEEIKNILNNLFEINFYYLHEKDDGIYYLSKELKKIIKGIILIDKNLGLKEEILIIK